MRNIKFRGLMTTGQWVYGLPHLDMPNETLYFNECSYRICWHPETGGRANAPIKNGTLGQFTGLHDRNGKEIYEGDIMCWQKYIGTEFHRLWVVQIDPLRATKTWSSTDEDAIVIGNIYENPELING